MKGDGGNRKADPPPTVDVQLVDVNVLGRMLDQAYETYRDDRLRGCRQALVTFMPLLRVTDPEATRGHRRMIDSLVLALADLEQGLQPELLRKRKVRGRPQDSMQVWDIRAHAARIADLLEMTGMTPDDANGKLAVLLHRYGFDVGRSRNPKPGRTVVARWRQELAAGTAPPAGNKSYQLLTARICGVPSAAEPSDVRREVLATFEEYLQTQTGGEGSAKSDLSE